MKRFILFFSAALLVGRLTLCAEDSKPQELPVQSSEAAPAASATPAPQDQGAPQPSAAPDASAAPQPPAALDQPISLIPETLPNTSKKSSSEDTGTKDSSKKSKSKNAPKENYSADAVKKRIRMREIKTLALKDDKIQAEMETAMAAKTDSAKREALKRYYNLLFDRMIKIDPSCKEEIEARRTSYLNRYDQTRLRMVEETLDFDYQGGL